MGGGGGGELLGGGVAGEGGRFGDLHLDQLVLVQLRVRLGDDGVGEALVADVEDGGEMVTQRPEVAALLSGQLSQPAARASRTAAAAGCPGPAAGARRPEGARDGARARARRGGAPEGPRGRCSARRSRRPPRGPSPPRRKRRGSPAPGNRALPASAAWSR